MKTIHAGTETALDDLPDRLVVAPTWGRVAIPVPRLFTSEGEVVRAGDVLATLEATEGETDVCAPIDAWVLDYLVQDGERVEPGVPIVHLRAL